MQDKRTSTKFDNEITIPTKKKYYKHFSLNSNGEEHMNK